MAHRRYHRFTRENYQHDEEFEKLGGPLLGDITKDILYSGIRGGADFSFGPLSVSPYISFEVTQTESYTLARVITVVTDGIHYPQDTESFVDIDEDELLIDPSLGVTLGFSTETMQATLNTQWSPLLGSSLKGGFRQRGIRSVQLPGLQQGIRVYVGGKIDGEFSIHAGGCIFPANLTDCDALGGSITSRHPHPF